MGTKIGLIEHIYFVIFYAGCRTTESHYFILDRWFCEFLVLQVGLKHLVLGRRSHPEAKNRDVIALGTPATASAWARSQFKSGDGTFKMTVKSFYQEKHLRASLILIDFNSDLYTNCMCHCAFSHASSNRLPERMQSHIGYIYLTFLHCAFSNASSNGFPKQI